MNTDFLLPCKGKVDVIASSFNAGKLKRCYGYFSVYQAQDGPATFGLADLASYVLLAARESWSTGIIGEANRKK